MRIVRLSFKLEQVTFAQRSTLPIFSKTRKRPPALIKDIMSSPPVTLSDASTLKEVVGLMCQMKVSSVVVVNYELHVSGIITERDIICAAANGLFEREEEEEEGGKVLASTIMSKDVVTVKPEDTIAEAVAKLKSFNIKRLVVVDPSKVPVGMITYRDILDASYEYLSVLLPPE